MEMKIQLENENPIKKSKSNQKMIIKLENVNENSIRKIK